MYSELIIGNETYKLRLNTRASVALEKALGKSPLSVFMELDNGEMPKLTDMIIILQACLQPYHHGFTMDKTYDLFDKYVEDGHTLFDLIPVFIEVFQESGYFAKSGAEDKETDGKN
jgi:hypothetical protein